MDVDSPERPSRNSPPLRAPEYPYETVLPGSFEPSAHYYPAALQARLHPTVAAFLRLSTTQLVERYCRARPGVDAAALAALLAYAPQHLFWSGTDLLHVAHDVTGAREMLVLETNSCPAGLKAMPCAGWAADSDGEEDEAQWASSDSEDARPRDDDVLRGGGGGLARGYRALLRRGLLPRLTGLPPDVACGALAVVYDKNPVEASGYAAALADLTGEAVHLVPYMEADDVASDGPAVRFTPDGVMEVRAPPTTRRAPRASAAGSSADSDAASDAASGCNASSDDGIALGSSPGGASSVDDEPMTPPSPRPWLRVRGAVRYVTQRPWARIPAHTRTVLLNGVLACLAGGRNKLVAAKAYANFNELAKPAGLAILAPATLCDVPLRGVAAAVARLGGLACVKVPYANAGQGVFTVTCADDLRRFTAAAEALPYTRFIVQALVGNAGWGQPQRDGALAAVSGGPLSPPMLFPGPGRHHVGTVPDARGGAVYAADLRMLLSGGAGGFRAVALFGRRAAAPLSAAPPGGAAAAGDKGGSWAQLGTNLSMRLGDDGRFASDEGRLVLADDQAFDTLGLGLPELVDAFVQAACASVAIDRMACALAADGICDGGALADRLAALTSGDTGLLAEVARGSATFGCA